jgi:predicted MFS family arabinose efflux permease
MCAAKSESGRVSSGYWRIVLHSGAGWAVTWGIVGRLPIGMLGLGIILLARSAGESFLLAGQLAAAFGVSNAVGAPIQGRLLDRIRSGYVLVPTGLLHGLSLATLVAVSHSHADTLLPTAMAAVSGLTFPQLSAALRLMWNDTLACPPNREQALAAEIVTVEVLMIAGPVLVSLLLLYVPIEFVLLTGAACATAGTVGVASTKRLRDYRPPRMARSLLGALASGQVSLAIAVALIGFGLTVGLLQVAITAFAETHSQLNLAGVLLGIFSAGSVIGGLLYVRLLRSTPIRPQPALLLAILAGCFWLFPTATGGTTLAILLICAGSAYAPGLIATSDLLNRCSPPGTRAEAYTFLITANVLGSSLGSSLGGILVSAGTVQEAFVVLASAASIAATASFLSTRFFRG